MDWLRVGGIAIASSLFVLGDGLYIYIHSFFNIGNVIFGDGFL